MAHGGLDADNRGSELSPSRARPLELRVWLLGRQFKPSDDSLVGTLANRPLRMTCRHPCNPALGICDDVGEPFGGDGEESYRLVRGIEEIVQSIGTFWEVHDVSGCKSLLALGRAYGRCPGEDEEHLLDAVVHVQRPARRTRQKLVQGSSQLVGAERVPKPSESSPVRLVNFIPRLVLEEVQATQHPSVSNPIKGR
jgi:hypothetical protein